MSRKNIDEILNLRPGEKQKVSDYMSETEAQQIEKQAKATETHPYLDALWAQGKFRDSGRKSTGYAESIDSILGAPVRQGISELQQGNVDMDAVKRVMGRVGADPKNAPDSTDIAMKATDNPYLGTAISTAVDFAGQIPFGAIPGTPAIIKGVKDPGVGQVADAAEAFAERGKAPLSTEAKIAAMHGQTGEVRDVVPDLVKQAEYEWKAKQYGDEFSAQKSAFDNPRNAPSKPMEPVFKVPKEEITQEAVEGFAKSGGRYKNGEPDVPKLYYKKDDNVLRADGMQGPGKKVQYKTDNPKAFWNDDQSFTDEAKKSYDGIVARFGEDKEQKTIGWLKKAAKAPDHMTYVGVPGAPYPMPNYSAKPTGVIGENRIQGMSSVAADPFSWMDGKYGVTKQLLLRHKSIGKPAVINTSSDLIAKKDYIAAIPDGSTVNLHFMSPDEQINRLLFPGNPSQRRLSKAADELEAAGINVNRVYPTSESLIRHAKAAYGTDDIEAATGMSKAAFKERMAEWGIAPEQTGPSVGVSAFRKNKPDFNYAFGGMVPHQNMAEGGVVQGFTNVLNPDGEVVSLPNNELQSAFQDGYQAAPPEMVKQAKLKLEYGEGFGNELKATAAGAARGATLGLSDLALTNSGLVEPETLSALQEFNPKASMAGELGGAAAAMFAPSGPVGLIGRAGKATAAGVKALNVARLANEGSMAAKVLGAAESVGATAAGSAVEGALYTGVGNSITEHSLGDPGLNGEKILANFGHGAFWGGAIGGALRGASIGIPEGIGAAKTGIKKIRDMVLGSGMGDEGAVLGMLDKVDPSLKLSDAMRNRAITLDVDQRAELVDNLTSELNSVKKNIDSSIKKLNDTIRPAEVDALIDTAAPPDVVQGARQGVIDQMNNAVKTMESEPHLYDPGPMRRLQLMRDSIVNKMGSETSPAQIMARLRETKQALQDIVYDKMSAKATASRDVIENVSSTIRDVVHNPDTFGLAGAAQSAHDAMLSKLYEFVSPNMRRPTQFQKAFMRKAGNGPGMRWEFDRSKVERVIKNSEKDPGTFQMLDDYFDVLRELPEHLENTFANVPNSLWDQTKFAKMPGILEKAGFSSTEAQMKYLEAAQNMKGRTLGMRDVATGYIAASHPVIGAALQAYNIASKPIEYINKLAALERMIGKTTNAIGRGAKSIFDPAIKIAESPRMAPLLSLSYDEKVGRYRQMAQQFAEHTNNPDAMIEALNDATGSIQDVAPDGTQSIQQAAMLGSQFLSSKAPFPAQQSPFSRPYIPSATELADFEHYLAVVESPVDALQEVRNGTLIPSTIETLQIVYPKLYEEMKARVIDTATDQLSKGEEIPFRAKQALSLFLSQPIDEILSPQSIMANQTAYAPSSQPQQQARPSKGGMEKMTIASRMKTRQDRPE